jgi:TP901 family phage tail tape measure protein
MPVQVNVAADQQNLINSIERGVRAYNQRFSKSNTINLSINERGFTQPLGRITGAVNDFESAMAASNARVIAFGASTAVLGTAIAGFRSLAKASIEVEKNLADVNRILQLSTSELQTFGKELFTISKRTATSFNDASKALLEFSRQGLSAEETLRRTNDALTLTRLAGLGAEASVAALTATVNGFAKSGITTTQVLNKLVAVEQAFAVSARDLSEGLSRTGQAAQEAGVNIDQLNALISAAQQRTARGGAVIGNALKTIFTRLQRSDTLDRLEEFNIAVRDVQGNTLPATTVLQNFANAYNRLADAQRAQLSEQVAGVYQVNILKAIVSDLNSEQSIYNAALIKGASATNEASRANAQLNQTLSALLVQVGNNTQQLASTIGSVTFEPLAKSAAKAANSIVEAITDVITGEGLGSDLANGLLKGIRNVLAGPGAIAAFYTLFKLVQSSFTYVAQALPQIAGITTESQKRKNLEQAILGILQSENNISKSLLGNTGNQAQQAKILLGVAQQQTNQYREQLRLAGSLATTLRGQGVSAGARGLQTGRTRSGGYIPASTKMAERAGAFAGGYAPGKVVNSPVGGVMNTAEDIKYMPGFAQPFINPPKNSRAGKLHRANAVSQVGVDPYMYGGFVPNFAKSQKAVNFQRGRSFEKVVGDLIGTKAAYNAPIDYKTVPRIPRGRGFNRSMYQPGVYADAHVGLGHTPAQIISKLLNHNEKYNNLEIREDGEDVLLVSDLVEIIGQGVDQPSITKKSRYGSLNATAKQNYPEYEGKMFRAFFDKDRVNIPNFAAAYRNPFTGALNNAAIARGLRTGALTEKQAQEMGYATSSSKIGARKAKRAAAVGALNYQMVYVPWDIEGFRGGRSGGRLNIAQGTAYESFILSLLRSGQLKGTTSLGQSFSLPARPDVVSSAALKGGSNARIDGYSLSAGEMYEMKAGGTGNTASGLQDKFIKAIENNPEVLNPKRKWKNYIFRTTAAKGRGASGGFIPNLAYKGEVMDLEEFISGQKAIYSETPFPHVRNESQPTFASAIADHGGLGNALKDSYRNQSAAGLTYGGYVPNFAFRLPSDDLSLKGGGKNLIEEKRQKLAREIDKAINSYKKGNITRDQLQKEVGNLTKQYKISNKSEKKVQQAVDKRVKAVDSGRKGLGGRRGGGGRFAAGLQGASTAIAIGGPLLAGQAEQYFFGGRERADLTANERMMQSGLSAGLTSLTTGVGIGAAFGPIGAAIGGVVGGFAGLLAAQKAATLSTEELAEANAKAAEQNQKNIDAASSYINQQKSLSSLIASGASDTEIENAAKALANNFDEIKDADLQQAFINTGGDLDEMNKKLQEYTALVTKRSAGQAFLSSDFSRSPDIVASQLSYATTGSDRKQTAGFFADLERLAGVASAQKRDLERLTAQSQVSGGSGGIAFMPSFEGKQQDEIDKKASEALLNNVVTSDERFFEGGYENTFKVLAQKAAAFLDITKENTSLYDDIVKKFADSLANGVDFKKIVEEFQKGTKTRDLLTEGIKASAVAEKTFNSIFRDLRESFSKLDSDAKAAFERIRSANKIDSALNDFADSINDQMASFIMGNVPDAQKYQLQQQNASRVAEAAIAKSNREFRDFDAKQNQDRAEVLRKNTEDITKIFQDNLSRSELSGRAFEQILPSIQAGNYDVDIQSVLEKGRQGAFKGARDSLANVYTQLGATPGGQMIQRETKLENEADITRAINKIKDLYDSLEEGDPVLNSIKDAYGELLTAGKEVQAYTNSEAETKIKNALAERKRTLDNFDLFQRTAREEAEVAKALAEEKIRFDKLIAEERAKTDNEILENQRRISEQISKAQYEVGLENINSQRGIAAIDRTLSDPRVFYGLDRTQRNEERFRLEDDRLKLQRDMEQRILDQEIAQSNLEIISRANNTNALMLLNETVASQYKRELEAQGAGGVNAQRIADYRAVGASEAEISNIIGAEAYTREMSYAENNQRIANAQSLKIMRRTEPGAALTPQEIDSFLKKAQEMPGAVGDEARQLKRVNDLRRANLKATNENLDKQRETERSVAREQSTMAGAFRKGVGEMNQQSQDILLNLAETAPSRFADGMANALSQVADGTKSIGDAFTDMAIDFGRMLQQEVFRALATKAIGSLLGNFSLPTPAGQTGGLMSKGIIKAQNGMYISGGRTGDRNLALLEDGEYVLNRNAVRGMGGPRALDKLNFGMAPRFQGGGGYSMEAARSLKNGEYDYTGDLMFNGANIGAINPDLYSAYAFENDAYFQRRRELARERFQRQVQKRFERRQKRAQLVGAIIGAAGSMFMSAGLGQMSAGSQGFGSMGDFLSNGPGGVSVNPNSQVGKGFSAINKPFKYNSMPFNSGGFVPHGSRLSDTIPAMLTGGEYVMNNSAVKKYGLGTMNSMNAGSYQSGGMASTTNNTNNNSTSISINVDRSGKAVYGASTNSYDKDDIVLSKEMARQINNLVLKSMVNEKRYGGELYKNPLRT